MTRRRKSEMPDAALIQRWKRCYEQGATLKAIGESYGFAPEMVRKYLSNAGVAMRPKGTRKVAEKPSVAPRGVAPNPASRIGKRRRAKWG